MGRSSLRPLYLLTGLAFTLSAACGGKTADTAVEIPRGDCDPLDPAICALPYPSSFFLEEADTVTGYQIAYGETSLPGLVLKQHLDPWLHNEPDGFSTVSGITAYFENASLEGAVRHWEIENYRATDVKTVLIDVETGERVPHWVELDDSAEEPEDKLLILRPAQPMRHGARHVVAIRGLVDTDGNVFAASDAFAALRDGEVTEDTDVESRRGHFEDVVFPAIEAQGFSRDELQLAWDFVTVSSEHSLGRVRWMRDDLLDFLNDGAPEYTIDEREDYDCGEEGVDIATHLGGFFETPLYTETDGAGTLLTRDSEGMPYRNGEASVDFTVRIPCSLATDAQSGLFLQYGHGLFGTRGEVTSGYLGELANDFGWVLGAIEWDGMTTADLPMIATMMIDTPERFSVMPERTMQGLVNAVAFLRLARLAFPTDENFLVDGQPLVDGERYGFYGNSQGGILGGAYVAMSPDLARGVLGVPSTPFSLVLPRSSHRDEFMPLLDYSMSPRERMLYLILAQTVWDPGDAAGWLRAISLEPEDDLPEKSVLIQAGIGDAQTSTVGARVMARAYQAASVAPAPREIFGVEEQEGGFYGSAIAEWSFPGTDAEPEDVVGPNPDTDTHDCVRVQPEAWEQLRDFVETGVVNQYCDGGCIGPEVTVCTSG